jgi:hypothetical protein
MTTITQTTPLAVGLPVLMDMLTYRRPAWGPTETLFIDRFLAPLPGIAEDAFGNLWLTVAQDDGDQPRVLFSSHTDSVHHLEGRQNVVRDGAMVTLRDPGKASKGKSNCLGADCAAGVWIMREMILAGVPGVYVFHRDEESGGRGSGWIADNHPEYLAGIVAAIAWDRKGYSDVITHQGSRTCSNAFADSLAAALGGTFVADDTGLFTDTAMYAGIIPECTNLSVGYFGQHGPLETQDTDFLVRLRDKALTVDWDALVIARDPLVDDERPAAYRWPDDYALSTTSYGTNDYDRWFRERDDPNDAPPFMGGQTSGERYRDTGFDSMAAFVRENPDLVADYLETCGFTLEDLTSHCN